MTAQDVPPTLSARGFDRSADERAQPGLLTAVLAESSTRVLVVHRDGAPLDGDDLHLRGLHELPTSEHSPEFAFLGRSPDESAVVAAVYPAEADRATLAASRVWASVRTHGALLARDEAELLVSAVSLGGWLIEAPFCPRCGTRTQVVQAGWARHCEGCGREHFPRTDPAVIMAVTHPDEPDLLLLGSNALWGLPRFSCFAGFVEAGESLEGAVARELAEEAGVEITEPRYRWSQAWPYPRSLMLGFEAQATRGSVARADGEEIIEVRWFTRGEIAAALEHGATGAHAPRGSKQRGSDVWSGRGEDPTGSVTDETALQLPGPSSIAYRLIADWCRRA